MSRRKPAINYSNLAYAVRVGGRESFFRAWGPSGRLVTGPLHGAKLFSPFHMEQVDALKRQLRKHLGEGLFIEHVEVSCPEVDGNRVVADWVERGKPNPNSRRKR